MKFCIILCTLVIAPSLHAATYYVGTDGSLTNNCLSEAQACLTIQQAANMTKPGDVVAVKTGTYNGGFIVPFSGTANAHITYMAAPGNTPVIQLSAKTDFWGIGVAPGISYIDIYGFKIIGSAQSVTQAQADAMAQQMAISPANAQSCIAIGGNGAQSPNHHITVYNNEVSFCPGAGIYTVHSDYISVIGNKVHDNAWWNWNGGSGISLYEHRDIDQVTTYKNFVMNNSVYSNFEKVKHPQLGVTDGNGIVIDKNENTDSNKVAYNGRTYIANNIVAWNGGNGIISYYSQHVDIVNNSTYRNCLSVINRGEIQANLSNDVNVLNNILYADSSKAVVVDGQSTHLNWDYNIVFGGNALAFWGSHDVWADPRYLFPQFGYFQLQGPYMNLSPAIGTGTSYLAPTIDMTGFSRTGHIDRGAMQYH